MQAPAGRKKLCAMAAHAISFRTLRRKGGADKSKVLLDDSTTAGRPLGSDRFVYLADSIRSTPYVRSMNSRAVVTQWCAAFCSSRNALRIAVPLPW